MSLGYCGVCIKQEESEDKVRYSYSGENWNDGGKSKSGDCKLQDGIFVIYKSNLSDMEICIESGVVVEKECKNAFKRYTGNSMDYIAFRLLNKIIDAFQRDGVFPDREAFIL